MSEEVKTKDVLIVLGIVAALVLVLAAAVWLFYPGSYGTLDFLSVDELEEGVPVIKITDEILEEYPMLAGPPKGIAVRDTIISQILNMDDKVNPSVAREIQEMFGGAYLDYDGEYYVIGVLVS